MPERVAVKQEVYYFDAKNGWLRGVVTSVDDKKVEVMDKATEKTVSIPPADIHGFMSESYDASDPELFHVSDLHVATLLYCIKDRFENLNAMYSLMGEMVLSVNPFCLMAINGEVERKKYLAMPDPRPLPPHIWQVAHKAFNAIFLQSLNNQSVVISGESGSGKTENTKSLIAYLGQLSYQHSNSNSQRSIADKIAESLRWSNPLMESFGNARTVRNDNSSRFGKYIKLYFDLNSGVMMGGETVTYLLEKSRIILQSEGERNYHIFYEMLAGLSAADKKKYGNLTKPQDYKCLRGGNTFTRRGVTGETVNDAEEFNNVRQAMDEVGISKQVQDSIFKVLGAILNLMEIEFTVDDNDKAVLPNCANFTTACDLLDVMPDMLRECFLVKSKTSLVTIMSNKTEAEGFRNAFCKSLYVSLFDRLVEFVNVSITPVGDCKNYKYIGLLDIFGFENFTRNSFEQICINYANESLQNHYNKYTFINDEEECRSEGIEVPKITFPDNSECLRMFDEKRTGIFSMLDEECQFKGGSEARFTQNLWQQWESNTKYFVKPKSTIPNQFGVNHYASFVQYTTDEWLAKNQDGLKEDMYECVSGSGDEFIRSLLTSDAGASRRKQTVAIRFQSQLHDLRQELESTETQFIRCIKPNMQASPAILDNRLVGAQLESAGVLQTIALKRQGYPVRRLLKQFCSYFYLIMPRTSAELFKKEKYSECSTDILKFYQKLYQWPTPNYAVGKTKVFLRAEVYSALERLVLRRRAQLLTRCNPVLSRWVERYRERKRIEEEKRLAELKRKREERQRKAEALANGLPAEKVEWVEEFKNMFPDMSTALLMDVAGEADSHSEALAALVDMQNERVNKNSPSTLVQLLQEAQVRPEVVDNFVSFDVNTISELSKMKAEEMRAYGCNDTEIASIQNRLMSQQSQRAKYERLAGAIGTSGETKAAEDIKKAESARAIAEFEPKVRTLTEMGFNEDDARLVLAHYNGDVQRSSARLLRGINRNAIRKHAAKHKDYNTTDSSVQRLIAMGVDKKQAKLTLRQCNGDIDLASRKLFATA